jgi:G3E family GTPase
MRVKGILQLGHKRQLVVQGVESELHFFQRDSAQAVTSALVVIGRRLDREMLANALNGTITTA